ncbi:LytTR family transcriptional regulator [Flavobacterium sp. F-65]|uniref:LytTR family transcriptional regulator n=1 Tax=Flavobacterium pisciphilum TaxID=2893755 RepID=A0ABS8MWB0_9FLAO|nr:LytTR family DNA-binding domain-containing protein [Flavobacterium sp. F-65]MCC9073055.1 LytTR family transcriptional regulator [Flavobacterium sp. F-65]
MTDEKFTFIKTDKKIIKLYFDTIAVIKGLGNYVQIITVDNTKYTYYKSLKDLIEVLPNEFMRVHNSYIVNLTTIDSIEDNHIIAKGNKVTIGKTYKECLINTLDKLML